MEMTEHDRMCARIEELEAELAVSIERDKLWQQAEAKVAELERERDAVESLPWSKAVAAQVLADERVAALTAQLAALETAARQLYNAGSETLSAIESVLGLGIGTLHENDLCAKPLLKALDAYRAVDALRAGEGK